MGQNNMNQNFKYMKSEIGKIGEKEITDTKKKKKKKSWSQNLIHYSYILEKNEIQTVSVFNLC